jgi:hypothetical protein
MSKATYVEARNKRALQKEIYAYLNCRKIVGLAGPSIRDYYKFLRECRFTQIAMYENSVKVLKIIAPDLPKCSSRLIFRFGDIYDQSLVGKRVYDLDFCCTMKRIEKYVKKFRENFVITVSLRMCSLKDTISLFCSYREEEIWMIGGLEDPSRTIVQTNKGRYMFIKYRDTAPMCIIYRLREK